MSVCVFVCVVSTGGEQQLYCNMGTVPNLPDEVWHLVLGGVDAEVTAGGRDGEIREGGERISGQGGVQG